MIHSHGAEDGPGLACRERRLPDGTLRGACLPDDPTARPADAAIAARLRELGKTRECVCPMRITRGPDESVGVGLEYAWSCPVHYPETSRVLRGDE